MSEWLSINPAKFNALRKDRIRGSDVEVMVSPYDVPSAVRAFIDRPAQAFVIEFKYIGGEEPASFIDALPELRIALGRNSKRIYKIEFFLEPDEVQRGQPDVAGLLDKLREKLSSANMGGDAQPDNLDMARRVVEDRAEKLVATG